LNHLIDRPIALRKEALAEAERDVVDDFGFLIPEQLAKLPCGGMKPFGESAGMGVNSYKTYTSHKTYRKQAKTTDACQSAAPLAAAWFGLTTSTL
jgi:hypothetical protein